MRFTKERRQEIIREFATRHNGHYNPRLFVDEVKAVGEEHPAYNWFEWDRDRAAQQHWLWQAREFANGLQVKFTIEEVARNKSVSVREVAMPFAISPVSQRELGGGYVVSDPNDPAHMAELCRQGAVDLAGWLRRYQAAVAHAGGSISVIERQLKLLEAVSLPAVDAEAA